MSGVGNQAEPRKDKLAPLDRGHILYQLKTNRKKVANAALCGYVVSALVDILSYSITFWGTGWQIMFRECIWFSR